jgi:PAS domain S-box-containing protein
LNLYANPADRAEAVRQLRAQKSLHDFEFDIQTKAGAIRRASVAVEMIAIGSQPFLLTVLQDITERRQAEEAIRQSEQRYAALFNARTNGIAHCRVITDEQGRPVDYEILQINAAYEEITGIKRADIEGHRAREVFPGIENYAYDYIGNYGRVALEGGELNFEVFFEGLHQWLAIYIYSPRQGEFTAIFTDISQRKQAELALQQSEHQYRGLAEALRNSEARLKDHTRELEVILDAVPAYVWITHDPQAREVTGNQLVYDLLRVKPGENISKTGSRPGVLPAYTPMHAGRELANQELPIQRVASSGIPLRNYDFELNFEDGRKIQLLGNVSPLLDENGKPAGAVSAFIDITSQRQSQEKLLASERVLRQANDRFRVALASAPITVFTTDNDLHITWMYDPQPAFQLEQVLGLRLDQVMPGPYGQAIMEILQSVLDSGQPRQGEIETLSYGKPTYFAYSIDPIHTESGDLVGLACAGYDITDHKRIELNLQLYAAELERSNQALVNFAFLASHDLQEPLRKIIMFTKNVRKNVVATLDAESEDYLDRMQNAAERMQTMIDGLLELSQVDRNGAEFAPVNLTRVIEDVVADLKHRIQALGGRVIIEELPTIDADELQMQHVFQNLVENALKFHKSGVAPVVRVSGQVIPADGRPAMVIIRVEDNGIGLAQQDAKRIFEPFTRLHGRNEYEGTGLGLAICQKIIERHRGTIEVQSSPGQGTHFILRLPVHSSQLTDTKQRLDR